MTTMKNMIIEALHRSNLVPRKRAVPADMLENGYRLMKGIIQKYNFENYISFSRLPIILEDNTAEYINISQSFGPYMTFSSVSSVSYTLNNNGVAQPLDFKSMDNFLTENNDYVYTWRYNQIPDSRNEIIVQFKPNFAKFQKRLTIIANVNLSYGLDDEVMLPEIYEELFIQALTVKLAITNPRTDGTQVQLLKEDLLDIEKVVKDTISSNKILTRQSSGISALDNLVSGNFIFGN